MCHWQLGVRQNKLLLSCKSLLANIKSLWLCSRLWSTVQTSPMIAGCILLTKRVLNWHISRSGIQDDVPPSHPQICAFASSSSPNLLSCDVILCCRYLGFFRAIGPITVAVLGIAITNIWHLECPTSDKNKVCGRPCVCLCPCLLCVHELSDAHGHATCPFSMLFAVHTTVC
jgi:hypothetical protein